MGSDIRGTRARATKAAAAAVAVVAGLLVTGVVSAAPAQAAFPGRNGRIAYEFTTVVGTEVGINIGTVNPDGSGKKQLTFHGLNRRPRWSADGRRIAFTRDKNIWVMNSDGSAKRQVTSLGRDLQPAWSPDGRQLVFIRQQANGRGDLFRLPTAGGAVTRLTYDAATSGGNDEPTWSPRGDLILFLHYAQSGKVGAVIKTVSVATKQQRAVPAGGPVVPEDQVSDPDFAPDGRRIVFMATCPTVDYCYPGNKNVMAADLLSPTRTELTSHSGIEGDWDAPLGVAAAPQAAAGSPPGFVLEICDGFDPRMDQFKFCGIRPGNVDGARDPDWQPLP